MKWLLMGAWLINGHPPVPFQVEFTSNETCQKAYSQMVVDFSRLKTRGEISAVCVQR